MRRSKAVDDGASPQVRRAASGQQKLSELTSPRRMDEPSCLQGPLGMGGDGPEQFDGFVSLSESVITTVVDQLRLLREASVAARQRTGKPVKLPTRSALKGIVEGLCAALFPNRLSSRKCAYENIDYFVGATLDTALRELAPQILLELQFVSLEEELNDKLRSQASVILHRFAKQLPRIRQLLETDIQSAYEGDPAARSIDEILVCYPGFVAIAHHRIAHGLYQLGIPLIARMIAEIAHSMTGIDIHPGAQIQEHFFIDHGTGVVIGETAVIGKRVRLFHGVTLGAKRFSIDRDRSLVERKERHPVVEDDVIIYAGATILGRITIGRGSTIGGNVWLTRSVEPGSNITQATSCNEEPEGGLGG